jgi:ribosomal protein L22
VPTVRVSATAKYLRASTRKTRLVTEAIKGKPVEEAVFTEKFGVPMFPK